MSFLVGVALPRALPPGSEGTVHGDSTAAGLIHPDPELIRYTAASAFDGIRETNHIVIATSPGKCCRQAETPWAASFAGPVA